MPALSAVDAINRSDEFEVQYRREVARKLDRLQLFGITLPERSTRYALSVAYITLSATGNKKKAPVNSPSEGKTPPTPGGNATLDLHDDDLSNYVRVDDALLQSQRLVIRGEAGSGKTTLLQWLAVNAARHTLDGPLKTWGGLVPFFIPLRHWVGKPPPGPEDFINTVANNIKATMPGQWVHDLLAAGRGLVLIDGVDELPQAQRRETHDWLESLSSLYPDSRYIVTTRPPAVGDAWLSSQSFNETELQPMTLTDIESFIEHWYHASCQEGASVDELAGAESARATLVQTVRERPPIRSLATTPLLCALLCALNRERRTQLPKDRLELYRISLETLLERRDVERHLRSELVEDLSFREKELILQDLAYWMLLNDCSDVSHTEAKARISYKIKSMPAVKSGPNDVFSYLLLRSGLLRQPTEGRIDFIHKTFQEYLVAKETVEQGNLPFLVNQAEQDKWSEAIVLTAGLARLTERESFLSGLLDRGYAEQDNRHRLHLLAIACLETCAELSPDLTGQA